MPLPDRRPGHHAMPSSGRRTWATVPAAALLGMGLMASAACSPNGAGEVIRLDAAPYSKRASLPDDDGSADLSPRVLRRYAPLDRSTVERSTALIDLGRMLYYEPRLSRTSTLSCNSCHPLNRYGATDTAVSTGVDGRRGQRNAPSTYHASGHFTQFWDGRAPTVELQAILPIQNPNEMDMSAEAAVAVLRAIDGYRDSFARAFPDTREPVTLDNIGIAIGAFERGLITPSRWDRYLEGDKQALTPREKEGAKLFANLGCLVCHTGPYVGGSMFEKVGARLPWPDQRDRGRREVTGNDADDMVFKVPSLRNVAQTAPYFHDGSARTLGDAVRAMARHQLGIDITDDEAVDIEHWLQSLTGTIPADYIAAPRLPGGSRP